MTTVKLFNTLGRRKEEFRPLKDKHVGLYTCGPTVYDYAHIGNLRTYIFEDILRRVLEYNGCSVKHVMNITDVGHLTGDNLGDADIGEDRMEMSAQRTGKSAWELAKLYTQAFFKDTERLNILKPHIVCKATDHIPEQIALVRKLEEKGYTYKISDGIYFDVSKFPDYGELASQSLEEKEAGARVAVNTEKRHPADFALWKFSPMEGAQRRQMEWPSPWGVGFPGWHIECSAMSTKYLGQPFDIHCGGVDHIYTHHPNEIAQSEAAEGVKMANFWLHGEFMTVESRRMGKSEGNAYLIYDIIKRGFEPLAFRYLCLNTHYRIQLNFTWQALEGAQTALERLREHVRNARGGAPAKGKVLSDVHEKFVEAINDDLNMPQALGVVWDFVRSQRNSSDKLATLLDFDRVLGLRLSEVPLEVESALPAEVQGLMARRETARQQKNFKEADALRAKIAQLGYEVIDTAQGPKAKKR